LLKIIKSLLFLSSIPTWHCSLIQRSNKRTLGAWWNR